MRSLAWNRAIGGCEGNGGGASPVCGFGGGYRNRVIFHDREYLNLFFFFPYLHRLSSVMLYLRMYFFLVYRVSSSHPFIFSVL